MVEKYAQNNNISNITHICGKLFFSVIFRAVFSLKITHVGTVLYTLYDMVTMFERIYLFICKNNLIHSECYDLRQLITILTLKNMEARRGARFAFVVILCRTDSEIFWYLWSSHNSLEIPKYMCIYGVHILEILKKKRENLGING